MARYLKIIAMLLAGSLIVFLGIRIFVNDKEVIVLIPDGYEGGVIVAFDRSDGKPEEWEGNKRLYRIPEDGLLETKFSPPNKLQEVAQFYYFDSRGNRSKLVPDYMDSGKQVPDTVKCVLNASFSWSWSEAKENGREVKYHAPTISYLIGKRGNYDSIYMNERIVYQRLVTKVKGQ